MENYSAEAELPPGCIKVIHFTSDQVHRFPHAEQLIANHFWGSTAWLRIYAMDTQQKTFTSNRAAFADTLNQKAILNRLKHAAVKVQP